MKRKKTIQYWLAELDVHENPTLIDGAHRNRAGVNKAAYLMGALHLGKPNRKFAVARVELTECLPSGKGVNRGAVDACNLMRKAVRHGDR